MANADLVAEIVACTTAGCRDDISRIHLYQAPGARRVRAQGAAGAFTTTAPFTLRGAFVWGPVMMLSLLTLLVRIRRRPKRVRLH